MNTAFNSLAQLAEEHANATKEMKSSFEVELDSRVKMLHNDLTAEISACRKDLEAVERAADDLMDVYREHTSILVEAYNDVEERLRVTRQVISELHTKAITPKPQVPEEFEPDVQR